MADVADSSDPLVEKKLDLISRYESQDRNVLNSEYGKLTPGGLKQTANGYWQITDSNWNKIAPQLNIDKPYAMAAEKDDQRKVARYLLTQTPLGVQNWKVYHDSPKFREELAALEQGGGKMPETQSTDVSKMSRDQVLQLVKENPDKYPTAYKKFFGDQPKPAAQPQQQPTTSKPSTTQQQPSVKLPAGGWGSSLREWATDPRSTDYFPGEKAFVRAAAGWKPLDRTTDYTGTARLADLQKSALQAATPIASAATIAGLLDPATTIPTIAMLAAGGAGTWGGGKIGEQVTSDPDLQEIYRQLGGVGGGTIGGVAGPSINELPARLGEMMPNLRMPRFSLPGVVKSPNVQAGALWTGAHMAGLHEPIPTMLGMWRMGRGKFAAPAESVESPTKIPISKLDGMVQRGSIQPDQYMQYLKEGHGFSDTTALAHLSDAMVTGQPQGPQLMPTDTTSTAQLSRPLPPTPITFPRGVTVSSPVRPVTEGTAQLVPSGSVPLNIRSTPPTPSPAPAPQQLPGPMGGPVTGTASEGIQGQPIPSQTGQPMGSTAQLLGRVTPPPAPVQPAPQLTGTPLGQQLTPITEAATPSKLGSVSWGRPVVDPKVAAEVLGAQKLTTAPEVIPDTETQGRLIRDAALNKNRRITVTSNDAVRKGIRNSLGLDFTPTKAGLAEARRLENERLRAAQATASTPPKGPSD